MPFPQILVYGILYAEFYLVSSAAPIAQVNFIYSNHLMRFTTLDHDEQFNNVFGVRNQIQCVYECFTRNPGSEYYYALYKSERLLCVCKRDFDWRSFIQIATDENAVVRIEIREGLIN